MDYWNLYCSGSRVAAATATAYDASNVRKKYAIRYGVALGLISDSSKPTTPKHRLELGKEKYAKMGGTGMGLKWIEEFYLMNIAAPTPLICAPSSAQLVDVSAVLRRMPLTARHAARLCVDYIFWDRGDKISLTGMDWLYDFYLLSFGQFLHLKSPRANELV